MPSDIRKWFMKKHDGKNGNAAAATSAAATPSSEKPVAAASQAEKPEEQESAGRRKTSKYFDKSKEKAKVETEKVETPAKRKSQRGVEDSLDDIKPSPAKKVHVVEEDDDDDFVPISTRKKSVDATPSKKLKGSSGRGIPQKNMDAKENDEEVDEGENETPVRSAGRGRGGRAAPTTPAGGRGRGGGGRGGFMNFGERKDPPHKGEKEVPEGTPDCLAGLTFVISGTLDSLEREEAEDLIKRHGGRVTGSVSRKTNYLLCDEDIGGRKSDKAKELGTLFLTEDGLFDMIRKTKKSRSSGQDNPGKASNNIAISTAKKPEQNVGVKIDGLKSSASSKVPKPTASASPAKRKDLSKDSASLTWTEKYKPKGLNDLVGNQGIVKNLQDWLSRWDGKFLNNDSQGKGKKKNDSTEKKAVLMSGNPGIGKTTTAKLVSKMLGYESVEVNASDSRGKADSKIGKGIGGSTANSIKELICNESLGANMNRSKHPKTLLIMDEVDGMSAGDRGGVADLIASIKISKIPIICICNDRYSQKLKSLVNYCEQYSFRKPTKQQMAKRLLQIAKTEGLQVNEIAMEELAERCNGDMRMAVNQLQYMSLSMSVIKYDDIRNRLANNAKDEAISPFTAVDKLFNFNAGKLRMDERIDLSMSDLDLVPLLIQENYVNYRPSSCGNDDMKRMSALARAAESIADGDLINVQIRRYRQWQLSQSSCVSSCIIPSSLMRGHRETYMPGERNFNRFGGWLGKNSTMGKNRRILEDLHVHMLASSGSYLGRGTIRLDLLTLLSKQVTQPLRSLPKEEAVRKVVEFMDAYSLSMEDYDTLIELSKFQGHGSPTEGILPAVKAALTKAYKEGSGSRVVRTADLVNLKGLQKAPKKRIAAMLEPVDEVGETNGDIDAESEEEDNDEADESEEAGDGLNKLKMELESNHGKGIQVQLELTDAGSSSTKNTRKAPAGRGRGGSTNPASGKRGGRGSGSATKRKR